MQRVHIFLNVSSSIRYTMYSCNISNLLLCCLSSLLVHVSTDVYLCHRLIPCCLYLQKRDLFINFTWKISRYLKLLWLHLIVKIILKYKNIGNIEVYVVYTIHFNIMLCDKLFFIWNICMVMYSWFIILGIA